MIPLYIHTPIQVFFFVKLLLKIKTQTNGGRVCVWNQGQVCVCTSTRRQVGRSLKWLCQLLIADPLAACPLHMTSYQPIFNIHQVDLAASMRSHMGHSHCHPLLLLNWMIGFNAQSVNDYPLLAVNYTKMNCGYCMVWWLEKQKHDNAAHGGIGMLALGFEFMPTNF